VLNRKHKSGERLKPAERRRLGIYKLYGRAVQQANERRNKIFQSASHRGIPMSTITGRLMQA
jgi:hypothetical protein